MPGERRTRFIKDKLIKARGDGSLFVHWRVFEPKWSVTSGRLELSTFGVDGMTDVDIWDFGYSHYLPSGRQLKGRADLPTTAFLGEDLGFDLQPPPPTHGSFVGWSGDKEDRLEIIAKLADDAVAVPHPMGDASPRRP